jgi:hypothetical protein
MLVWERCVEAMRTSSPPDPRKCFILDSPGSGIRHRNNVPLEGIPLASHPIIVVAFVGGGVFARLGHRKLSHD